MLFEPTIGIVGNRDIRVIEILSSDIDPDEDVYLGRGPTITYVLRTESGELYWALHDTIAEEASALLFVA